MLVSTFEILFKPITPNPGNIPGSDRTVLQGYFLTLANTSDTNLTVRLEFTATTPSISLLDTFVIADVTGGNAFSDLQATADPKKFTFDVRIPACDTALFILQPDITRLEPGSDTVEIRGYVDVSLTSPRFGTFSFLVTPEHRGTFFAPGSETDFDQLVYTLPTATGSSLYELSGPGPKLLKPEVDKPGEKQIEKIPEDKRFEKTPDAKVQEITPQPQAEATADLQRSLSLMAQTVDALQNQLAAPGQAFVSPAERPDPGTPPESR